MEEEQKEPFTSTSQGGGRRGDGDIEEPADHKQQLSPATVVVDDHERKEMEKDRRHQDLALSNNLVIRDSRVRPQMNFFDFKEAKTTSTSSTSQGRRSGGDDSGQRKRKRSPGVLPVKEVDHDEESREMKMTDLARVVFSNSVISSHMWTHLSFTDLKATREVSRDFNRNITSCKRFKNSAVLQITTASVESLQLFDKNSPMTWHGIQIAVDLPLEVLDKIRNILEHVQFISFVVSPLDPESADFINENYAKFIAGVLSSTPKLTALKIDVRLLQNNFSQVWSCHVVRNHLKSLESLEFHLLDLKGNSAGKVYRTYGTWTYRRATNIHFSVCENSARNLQQLATALVETAPPCRLKRLRVPKLLRDTPDRPVVVVRPFIELLRRHRQSLLEVSIPDAWDASYDVGELTLPQLKSLTTKVSSYDTVTFEKFLMNHPDLEELDVVIDAKTAEVDEDIALWNAIKRRCTNAAGAYLKKVHLKSQEFYWSSFEQGVVLDCSFLKEMEALEDFRVEILFVLMSDIEEHDLGIGPRILESLPRNRLKRLSLNGIHLKQSFWRVSREDREDVVSEEVPLDTKLELLGKFTNLKHLSFRHSMNAVDDDVIQFIFREIRCLEELEVSHCCRLTDIGISGTGAEQEERVSIQSLKELKVLSIRACPSVTPECLLSVLALPFLRNLDYFTERPVPKSFVRGIAAQNPSLETISVHTTGDTDDSPGPNIDDPEEIDNGPWSAEEKKAFFKQHPRIKALHDLEYLGLGLAGAQYATDSDED